MKTNQKDKFQVENIFKSHPKCMISAVLLPLFATSFLNPAPAHAYDGIIVSDLPRGGDVTVPGRYPIRIPPQTDVTLSGMQSPQAVTLSNTGDSTSRIQIYAHHELNTRTISIQPGTSAVYNFKKQRPIRVRVLDGKVEATSLEPVKIQR